MRLKGPATARFEYSSRAAWPIRTGSVNTRSRTTVCDWLMKEDDGMQITVPPGSEAFVLRLYVAGQTPKCMRALVNLKRICEQYLANRYRIEMIDLLDDPALARGDQIL